MFLCLFNKKTTFEGKQVLKTHTHTHNGDAYTPICVSGMIYEYATCKTDCVGLDTVELFIHLL